MAGLSREDILYRDRSSVSAPIIDRYSPAVSQNIPVFRETGPETGWTALSAGQKSSVNWI